MMEMSVANSVSVFSPAKINLFLAITGRRADGFHELVSVAAPVRLGDVLAVEAVPEEGGFSLECDDPAVPVDETNLVLKAARAFAAATGWRGGARFRLAKRIPMGAGLGGGSSNAVAALRGLNTIADEPLDVAGLAEVAATLGSDCPLFLHEGPVVMRGRGERIEALPAGAAARVRGRRVAVFKPAFGIATAWAYGRMAAVGTEYLPAVDVEARLANWMAGEAPVEELLANNMEAVAFEKHVALPAMIERLRERCGVETRMSGSGSACFAVLGAEAAVEPMREVVMNGWGPTAFFVDTVLV